MADPRKFCCHCRAFLASRPRGLCWTCYYTPGVKELYPSTSKYARRCTVVVTPAAARLFLWSALVRSADWGAPSRLSSAEWERATAGLEPAELVVVALHLIRGLTLVETGAWFGVSRGWASQQCASAVSKLKGSDATEVLL